MTNVAKYAIIEVQNKERTDARTSEKGDNIMKRYGIKEALHEIDSGAEIVYWEFFTMNAGYKLTKDDEIIGYLTANTAEKIIRLYDCRSIKDYYYTRYTL